MPTNCAACTRTIADDDDDVFAVGENEYHAKCFKCAQCRKSMSDGQFFEVEGQAVCSDACADKLEEKIKLNGRPAAPAAAALPKPSDVDLPKCDGCGKQFQLKEDYISLKSKEGGSGTTLNFHDACFVCSECKQPIGKRPYGVSHGKPIHADGPCAHGAVVSKTQGANEFEEDLVCVACNGRIQGRKKTVPDLGHFHLTCLRCANCSLGIQDDRGLYVTSGKVYCHRDSCKSFR